MFFILLVDVLLPFVAVLILFLVVLSFFEVASLRGHFASLRGCLIDFPTRMYLHSTVLILKTHYLSPFFSGRSSTPVVSKQVAGRCAHNPRPSFGLAYGVVSKKNYDMGKIEV